MTNIVNSIGFDLERVHTGLIVYLVDLWRSGCKTPLQEFFGALDVNLQGYKDVKAEKEHENIDLVLCDQNKPVIAIEMKVHNHESCVPEKKPRSGKNYQTVEYPERVEDTCSFLYVTLGTGELYRRKPYGEKVRQVGLEEFAAAVGEIADPDPMIEAWEKSLLSELEFRTECENGCREGKKDEKKWNVYFLGFLREGLENGKFKPSEADLTVYRHSQDTILNLGIKKPPENASPYCYMEINGNGKLNLKANLEALEQKDKRDYVDKRRDYYKNAAKSQFDCIEPSERANLGKSRMLLSFDVGIKKKDGFLMYAEGEGREQVCEQISKLACWFSETSSR